MMGQRAWNNGMQGLGDWNTGILEHWVKQGEQNPILLDIEFLIPFFHSSNIPSFH
jgi:hypothetical protein